MLVAAANKVQSQVIVRQVSQILAVVPSRCHIDRHGNARESRRNSRHFDDSLLALAGSTWEIVLVMPQKVMAWMPAVVRMTWASVVVIGIV